jgi:ornithine carbamoyltransferase
LSEYSGVPVWNGLTDDYHPTQILADLLTIKETFGTLKDCTVAYVGDGRNNVANSLMMGCAKAGVRYVCCTPNELRPDESVLAEAEAVAKRNGVDIRVFSDPKEGVKGANVLYTDVWVSMGEEAKTAERIETLKPYQINMDLMRATGNIDGKLMFLHCLPAFHDFNTEVTKTSGALEVTDEVFESKYSKVFDESENRMHTIKALFVSALCDRKTI